MKPLVLPLLLFISSINIDQAMNNSSREAYNEPGIEELNDTLLTLNTANQIATNDLTIISQPPILQREITPPEPILHKASKTPLLAVGLSALFPGLGHIYLDDMKTAGGLMSSTGLGASLALSMQSNEMASTSGRMFVQNTWMYSIYASYRDARLYNGNAAYAYSMPTDHLSDLAYAPFQFSILKKPEVWGGIIGALAIGIGTVYFAFPHEAHIRLDLSHATEMPFLALPIGIGEESFFRGYLQSTLAESCTPWGGIALSSLAFGAAHIPNAMILDEEDRWRYYCFSLPVITGMGAYFGWLTHKNHSLKESVAVHTWYDFIIMSASVLASYKASAGKTGFAFAIPF